MNEKQERCKDCKDLREHYYGGNFENTLQYCGIIENISESAIDINKIEKCPKEYNESKYS